MRDAPPPFTITNLIGAVLGLVLKGFCLGVGAAIAFHLIVPTLVGQ